MKMSDALDDKKRNRQLFVRSFVFSLLFLALAGLGFLVIPPLIHEPLLASLVLTASIMLEALFAAYAACSAFACLAPSHAAPIPAPAVEPVVEYSPNEEPEDDGALAEETPVSRLRRGYEHFNRRELIEAREVFDGVREADLPRDLRQPFRWTRASTHRVLDAFEKVPNDVRYNTTCCGLAEVDFVNMLFAMFRRSRGPEVVYAILDGLVSPTAPESMLLGHAAEYVGDPDRAAEAYETVMYGAGSDLKLVRAAHERLNRLLAPFAIVRRVPKPRPAHEKDADGAGLSRPDGAHMLDDEIESALAKSGMRTGASGRPSPPAGDV